MLKVSIITVCYNSSKTIERTIKSVLKQKYNITGIINAAGIASMNLALTTPSAMAEKIVQTNLLGTIYCCQHFAPFLIRHNKGTIINFSTIAVTSEVFPTPGIPTITTFLFSTKSCTKTWHYHLYLFFY